MLVFVFAMIVFCKETKKENIWRLTALYAPIPPPKEKTSTLASPPLPPPQKKIPLVPPLLLINFSISICFLNI